MASEINKSAKQIVKNKASTASSSPKPNPSNQPEIFDLIFGDPILLIILASVAVAIAIIGVLIYIFISSRTKEEEFDKQKLEKIVKPELKKVVKNQGKPNGSTVRRDLRAVGEIYKDVRFTENGDLVKHMQELAKDSDNDFNPDLDISKPEEEELDKWVNAGVYSEEQKKMIQEKGIVPHRLMWSRPASFTGKLTWVVTDVILGMDVMSSFDLIPEHKIVDNPADNSVSIDRDLQLRPFAGVNLPLKVESFGILHSVVMRNLLESSLEDQANYSKKINFMDSSFSQKIQRLEAEAQAEQNKYNSGVAGDVNHN